MDSYTRAAIRAPRQSIVAPLRECATDTVITVAVVAFTLWHLLDVARLIVGVMR